jgi:hypothetical protein
MLKPQPVEAIRWRDPRLVNGYLAIVVAGILGLLWLSHVVINSDEYLYSGEARTLLHGRLVPVEGDPFPAKHGTDWEGARYPPGWPLALALGALWNFRSMFVVAILVHLIGGAAMARMMVRRGLPSVLCAVWLFHPLFWSFSRTLMADVPAVTLLLLAMDAWENGQMKTSAVALGYSFLVRMSAPLTTAGFGLAVLADWRRRWRPLVILALGVVGGWALLLGVNTIKFGHPFRSPYASAIQSIFSLQTVAENAWIYGLALLAIPPFPLLCLLVRPRSCDRWAWVALPVVGMFLFYGYRDASPRFLENLLGGQRLILAAHAALLIATAEVWSRIPLIRFAPVILAVGVAAAVGHHFLVRHLEQRYAPAAQAVAACQPRNVIFNQLAARVALSTDAISFYLMDDKPPALKADVAILSLNQLTNRFNTQNTYKVPAWLASRVENCRRYGEFYVFDLAGRCPQSGEECIFPADQVAVP